MGYIKIPKELFAEPLHSMLSSEAKLLYGLLEDRATLSAKNGERWKTKENEVFVYFTLQEVARILGCGHDKATHVMSELEKSGLIRRYKRGCGKPRQIVVKPVGQIAETERKASRNNRAKECGFSDGNNTDYDKNIKEQPDRVSCINDVEEEIKSNIEYDILVTEMDKDILKTLVSVAAEAVCSTEKKIKVANKWWEKERVKERILGLNDMHVRYIFARISEGNQAIYAPRQYLLNEILSAEDFMEFSYACTYLQEQKKG